MSVVPEDPASFVRTCKPVGPNVGISVVPNAENSYYVALNPEGRRMAADGSDNPEPCIVRTTHGKVAPNNHVLLLLISEVDRDSLQ